MAERRMNVCVLSVFSGVSDCIRIISSVQTVDNCQDKSLFYGVLFLIRNTLRPLACTCIAC